MSLDRFSDEMSASRFLAIYWYVDELRTICRQLGLPTTKTKAELTRQIAAYLNHEILVVLCQSVRKTKIKIVQMLSC